MLIDTHCHLYVNDFGNDRSEVVQSAIDAGVNRFFLPNIDSHHVGSLIGLERKFPEYCFAMMGLHPCSVNDRYEEELEIVERWLKERPFAAIGEIGIDLYWDITYVEEQEDAFDRQIKWAIMYDRPIVIHSRESVPRILEILRSNAHPKLRGVFHCFSGTVEQGREAIEMGFYLGIGGVLTFKNGGLDKTMTELPVSSVVLETDAPYLAPAPHRGKRNEPSYLPLVAQKLAEIKGMSLEEVATITTDNALRLFHPFGG